MSSFSAERRRRKDCMYLFVRFCGLKLKVFVLKANETNPSDYRPFTRTMSAQGLTSEAQLRYLLQWFGEFSELQKEDFLPVLAAAKSDRPELLAASLAGLTCEDKPVSLFQCRIKLFNEWYPTWTEDHQDRLVKGVSETDPDFGKKLQDLMENGPQLIENGPQFNHEELIQNGTGEAHSPDIEEPMNGDVGNDAGDVEDPAVPAIALETAPVEIAAAS